MNWNKIYRSKVPDSYRQFNDDELSFVLSFFPDIKSAIDIGCGRGELMEQLEKRGIKADGIDISSIALSEARKRVKGKLIESDVEVHEFENYDLVFVKFVLAFVKNQEVFLDKLLKIKNKGVIIVSPISKEGGGVFVKQSVLAKLPIKAEKVLYHDGDRKLSIFIV